MGRTVAWGWGWEKRGHEWDQATQIEPAVPKSIPGYTYEDYGPLAPDHYLDRTAHWVRRWKAP